MTSGTAPLALALTMMAAGGPASGAGQAAGKVLSVDVSQFPAVRLTVSLPGTADLKVGDVQLTENGQPIPDVIVKSLAVSNGEYQSVAFAIDNSKQTSPSELKQLTDTAHAFIAAVPSTVPFGVVTLASKPQSLVKIAFHDQPAARRALDSIRPSGSDSALSDGLIAATKVFPIRGQHNILVLSASGSWSGSASSGAMSKAVQKAGARVFAITLGSQPPRKLTAIAAKTGGSTSTASGSDLSSVTGSLAHQIGDQYLLAYQSVAGAGDRLDLAVTVNGQTIQASTTVPTSATPGFSPTPNPALFSGTRGYLLIVVILVALLVLSSLPGRLRHRRNRAGRGGGPREGRGGGGGRGRRESRGGGRGRRQREGRNRR
ncbi:MAG: VWA domain-containing protein [Actinomycetota bacterium]|nr:VWA domain-containing protein [Actinomycetota bacterium]